LWCLAHPGVDLALGAGLRSSRIDREVLPMSVNEQHLSPAEAARRLGLSPKALRLYEEHGLVTPVRAANGWRVYGPREVAVLHQVVALKRLGLPLSRIAELLNRRAVALETLLAVQERALAREVSRVEHALALVRAARATLATGKALSVDDLINLTKETTMTTKVQHEEMKAIFDPIVEKHFTPGEMKELGRRAYDQQEVSRAWDGLMTEAKTLMAKGDPGSPEAMEVARRWMALVGQFTGGDPGLAAKVKSVWNDAMADPKAAPKLPLNPEVFAFVGEAWKKAQAAG
jgi:DNA-binding transcriptional MerR regulator